MISLLERWHEIHDAYVTFFGDDHRPAAVACADHHYAEINLEWTTHPGAVWKVDDPKTFVQIQRNPYKRQLP